MALLPPFELKQLALGAVHRVVRPPSDLRPWVACFWSMSARADSDEIVLIPDACVDFIISRQDPGGGFLSVSPLEAQSIALGQHTYYGIRFLPGVFTALTRIPTKELASLFVQASDVQFPEVDELESTVAESHNEADMFSKMQAWVRLLLASRSPELNPKLAYALDKIYSGHRLIESDIGSLIGPRQLRRLFAEQTGLSPRSMIQIMRFQRALDEFVKAVDQVPSEYFDQAHWIKECKRFTGMTPGSLRRALIARMSDSYNEHDRIHATLTL